MSASRKRPSNYDDREGPWDDTHGPDEETNSQGSSQQQEQENTEAPAKHMTQTTAAESASTSKTTAPSRRPKKPRRGKHSPEPNYSQLVQGQMSSTNRTGQACDRCKGRKMKCDSNSTGCANCVAGNLPCTQTDPITRVSYTRGELERLRADNQRLNSENGSLRAEIADLRNYISSGIGPQASGLAMGASQPYTPYDAFQAQAQAQAHAIHQAAHQPGQGFPIIYPPSRRAAGLIPSMQDASQFGVVAPPSPFPTYHTPVASNPYTGRDHPVPTHIQQVGQSPYRHGAQQQQQQGAQQGLSQGQVRGQEESHQQTRIQKRDNDPSQDPPDSYNYFSGM
ncbi:hypothetical protein MGYG_02719 [Nannizzia gypsea CBS 118893]|uniref:Zn(2)-C6 fungal-type domain-containing protein n=1 Tax=Arthroderma gypseum (strain ATCC MYA-4604 / CBS 118893) TaxID=535722 RepID=E4UNV2_ARTGP|nr:hypothetical protein MGYG_02719 [Nannizzia gypsea CBS 118893]EFQ99705.1 hypothetical protein MGYG_02719 [Nannizzia gypsea CBS 118893]